MIDDNSPDGTQDVVRRLQGAYGEDRIVRCCICGLPESGILSCCVFTKGCCNAEASVLQQ